MPDVTYISSDIDVQIAPMDSVEVEFDDSVLIYGNLPRGGSYNNILVKLSDQDYHSGWKTLSELGFVAIYSNTTQSWNEQTTLISESGALYIYSDYNVVDGVNIPNIKVGDGQAYVVDLPFVSDDIRATLLSHINDSGIHVTVQKKNYWDNKVTAFIDSNDPENLVLSKNDV